MCLSSPHIDSGSNVPVQYLHNTFLDSGMIGQGFTTGRNQLRIDLNTPDGSGVGTPPVHNGIMPRGGNGNNPQTVPTINQPGAVPGAPTLQQPGLGITVPSPGTVTPTVGGSLAGSVPSNTARGPMPVRGFGIATK